jgi:hypothetical protein
MCPSGFSANVAPLAAVVGTIPLPTLAVVAEPSAHVLVIVLRVIAVTLAILRLGQRVATGRPVASSSRVILVIVFVLIIGGFAMWKYLPMKSALPAVSGGQMRSVQTVVTTYMYSRASSPSSIQFLEWSDLQNSGADWLVTVRYSATQRSGDRTTATVRFTVRAGAVTNAQVLRQG